MRYPAKKPAQKEHDGLERNRLRNSRQTAIEEEKDLRYQWGNSGSWLVTHQYGRAQSVPTNPSAERRRGGPRESQVDQ